MQENNTEKPFDVRKTPLDYTFTPSTTMFGTTANSMGLWLYDEALLTGGGPNGDARAMRLDASIMSLLQCRYLATATRNWEVVSIEDEYKDQAAFIEKILKRTPKLTELFRVLLEAIFYGKMAVCCNYRWDGSVFYVKNFVPIMGDKLTIKAEFDEEGEPVFGYLVNPTIAAEKGISQEHSMRGNAHFLTDTEREAYIINTFWLDDQWSQEPLKTILAFGAGIRNYIYLMWLQRNILISNIATFSERQGTGMRLYYFESGNAQALQDMKEIAASQTSNTNIFIPRVAGVEANEQSNGIEFVDPPTGGIQTTMDFIAQYYDTAISRMVLGQSLTTEARSTGLGSNLGDVHERTFLRIVDYDAANLAETITKQLVNVLCKYNFGTELPIAFKFLDETQDIDREITAIETAKSMGMPLSKEATRKTLDIVEPTTPDDQI